MNDSRNLRVFGANFDYIQRDDIPDYKERHDDAIRRIEEAGSLVSDELAIRDAAIDFLHKELTRIGTAAVAYVNGVRMLQLFDSLNRQAPEVLEDKVDELFYVLQDAVDMSA